MKKTPETRYPDFDLIPNTDGKLSNGVYLKKDKSELIICFAWGDNLHFAPLEVLRDLEKEMEK